MINNKLKERLLFTKCDVTKESDVKEAIKLTVSTFGSFHVSLACAGVAWPTMTLSRKGSLDMKIFETEVKSNLLKSAYVAEYSAVAMSKNTAVNERGEKGLILFVSRVAAEEGQRG
jgi:3-hydroxyacyl-CoA dehydrogenase / 3-hydroxy-2-methylbutyryl-CoA dehydrogenase